MRNNFPKRTWGVPLYTLSKLYDVPVGVVTVPSFETVFCYICGRRRVAVARYRIICLVHLENLNNRRNSDVHVALGLQAMLSSPSLATTLSEIGHLCT